MAITDSWGYEGEINAPEWAQMLPYAAGMQYGVKTFAAWRPTIGGAGDRALTIAAGDGWGHGVMDRNDAPVTLNLPASSSGSRWDLIVARRVWATGSTTFARVAGSATKAIPERLNTPGVEDEQPIALARVQASSAAVVELVDLRCVPGDSGLLAFDDLALQYLTRVGTRVRVNGREWMRDVDGLGNPVWTNGEQPWTAISHLTTAQNGSGVYPFGAKPVPGGHLLRGFSQKRTGTWAAGNQIATLPVAARPSLPVFVLAPGSGNSVNRVRFNANGTVILEAILVGTAPTWVSFDGVLIPQ